MANENCNPHDLVGKKKNKRNHNKRKFRNRAHEPSAHGASPKQNKQSLSLSPTAQPSTTSSSQQHDQDHDQPLQQQLAENYQGVTTPPPPPIEHLQGSNSYKSPRKEAISRYKQDHLNSFNAFSDLKENLKSNDTVQRRGQQPSVENNDIPSLPLSLDDKISLFKYKSVEILEIANQNNISGSLLAHGIFEVFQLHRGDVTFLSCGSTFVYPLLPKTKILRINLNQFMLPLAKPERYWKISVHCEDKGLINVLVSVFRTNVQFISLYEQNEPQEDFNIDSIPKELQSPRNMYILTDIPDSPPSPPISPSTYMHSPVHFAASQVQHHQPPQTLSQPHIPKKESIETLNSNLASLDINSKLLLHHPKPKRSHPKYSTIDEKSESSMDSLLDEYEQNLSKSAAAAAASRPPTRQPSIVSTPYVHGFPGKNDNGLAQYYPIENRVHNYSRSRRSSRSELYTSESGWMEPNLINGTNGANNNTCNNNNNMNNGRKIPKSRSTYSINSAATDLYNIYRNIQLRNTQNNARIEEDAKSIKSMSRLPSTMNSSLPRSELSRRRQSTYAGSVANGSTRKSDVKLDSREIYRMLSSKPDKPILRQPTAAAGPPPVTKSTSFASRLFGW